MALIGRMSATRGTLIKLRNNLELVQSGKDILKVKRDRLLSELNSLLDELSRRKEIEERLMMVYADLKEVLAFLGYAEVFFAAQSVSKMEVAVTLVSFMGVVSPRIVVKSRPELNSIENVELFRVAENLQNLVDALLGLAQIEAKVERIAYELMRVNRKVNALEKVIIPRYVKQIKSRPTQNMAEVRLF